MANGRHFRTVTCMTIIAPPLSLPIDTTDRATRLARRTRRFGDGKLDLIAGVPTLSACRRPDLEALGATADLVFVGAGTELASGAGFGHQWWMPGDGWLLAEGGDSIARTIPAGWSWTAPHLAAPAGRLSAPRKATVLVAPVQRMKALLHQNPRLGAAIRATLVGGDV
jgi:hypothetical protein